MAAMAGGNQFWFKFIALLWVLVTIWVFYKLAQKVFDLPKWGYLATGLLAMLISWPKMEGNIANAELFFLLPTLGAMYLLWAKPKIKTILIAGILLGLGALFKMPAVLEAGIWPIIWLFEKDREWWKKTVVLGAGVAIPIGLSMGYFSLDGSLKQYLTAAWVQNLPYLSSWKAPGGEKGIYSLTGRAAVMILWIVGVLITTKKQERRLRVVGVWTAIGLFAGLLSGRPYPHYLIQAGGGLAVGGMLIICGSKKEKVLGVAVIGTFLAAAWLFKFYNYPVIGYYRNFGVWIAGKKSQADYFSWFNSQVPNNYKIAGEIQAGSKPGEKIFIWGDEPMIYALAKRQPAGKYTVKYHIKDYKAERETILNLEKNPPKYIVSFGKDNELPGLEELVTGSYRQRDQIGGATIYRLLGTYN
jgi:4-amino-4-deoxy-L-arabinose transferase-like glycosyltransferase